MQTPILCQHMYVSKAIRSFLDSAKYIIFGTLPDFNLPYDVTQTKYVIHSSHDWTVSQHLLFLDATNGNFTNVPFASEIVYELHSTDGCTDASCFWVETIFNGMAYEFVGDCAVADKCTYDEFITMITTKKGFVSTTTGYADECATPWTPPSHQRRFKKRL